MCERRLFGLDDGLVCSGEGPGHTHVYSASDAPDRHDASEAAADRREG